MYTEDTKAETKERRGCNIEWTTDTTSTKNVISPNFIPYIHKIQETKHPEITLHHVNTLIGENTTATVKELHYSYTQVQH